MKKRSRSRSSRYRGGNRWFSADGFWWFKAPFTVDQLQERAQKLRDINWNGEAKQLDALHLRIVRWAHMAVMESLRGEQ